VYLNGYPIARNANGYLGFQVTLSGADTPTGLLRGDGAPNVLAIFVDADTGAGFSDSVRTGWWYEGGGIYRHARLVRAGLLTFARDGIAASSSIKWAKDGTALEAMLTVTSTVQNDGPVAITGASINFTLVEHRTGAVVGVSSASSVGHIAARETVNASGTISVASPLLWTLRTPELYTVIAQLWQAEVEAESGAVANLVDAVNTTHGFREIVFSGAGGTLPSCALNGRPFKWRGFCDHDNYAVVGMGVPDRIKLYRAQMSRAVGGNSRRTSHNPPDPVMLSIYDALGMMVMDETRIFDSRPSSVDAMAGLVRRDRNHPSVAMWSFCNEVACEASTANASEPQAGAPLFAQAVVSADPGGRPTSANTPGWHGNYPPWIATDELTRNIDIQGFSHSGGVPWSTSEAPGKFHAMAPFSTKPVFGSECCSCNTMRDEDVGCESSNGQQVCVQKSFAADCSQAQTEVYDLPDFIVGTMVWTLFDYYGEPSGGWPFTISSFGQFDLAGFPKAQVCTAVRCSSNYTATAGTQRMCNLCLD